jgi:PKD repeat protein
MATSNIAYRINYSNRGRSGKAGSVDNFFVIDPLGTNESSTEKFDAVGNKVSPKLLTYPLKFTGYRNPVFGEQLWTNMLQLLENFASTTIPTHPQLGQLWFDKRSALGTLKLCTDPIGPAPATATSPNPTWAKVNNRIIVSTTAPTVSGDAPQMSVEDPTLWYNPDNMGLFYWDPTVAPVTTVNSPYTTLDPTGPTGINGSPNPGLHPHIGTTSGAKWVNVFYHRYASITEYNSFANQFAAWSMPGRPMPVYTQPTDAEWVALIQYVRNYAVNTLGLTVSPLLVDTTFKYYSTDRFGIGMLQQYYDTLVSTTNAIFTQLAINQTPVPIASFTPSRLVGALPMAVTFVDNSSNAAGATYAWNFGDGSTSNTASSTSHTYTSAGTFTATLTITNGVNSSTVTHSIQSYGAPIASFTRTPASGTAPLSVAFTDTSLGVPTSWLWNFGNGVTSTAQHPTYSYTAAGNYTITLTATNDAGSATASTTVSIAAPVLVLTPVAGFSRSAVSGIVPLTVTFVDTSTNSPTSWAWNFGDGGTAATRNASHTYSIPGTYTVTLTATNSAGSNSITSTVAALVPAVIPSFIKSTASGSAPLTVQFTDTSVNSPTSWSWNFGDGATSTAQNPSHVYTTAGTYTVTLNALNSTGGSPITSTVTVTSNIVNITVLQNMQNVNIYNNRSPSSPSFAGAAYISVSGTYAPGSIINFIVPSGITIGAGSTAVYALDTGTGWDALDTLTITNNGTIVGHGGVANGGAGGPALRAQRALTVVNNGTIGGGGGAGGVGSAGYGYVAPVTTQGKNGPNTTPAQYYSVGGGGGGGGAGNSGGAGGSPQGTQGTGTYNTWTPGTGGTGTTITGGAGGGFGGQDNGSGAYVYGGQGGAGGTLGVAGTAGSQYGPAGTGGGGTISDLNAQSHLGAQIGQTNSYTWVYTANASAGGAAGAAVVGNAYINWTAFGTRLGAIG